MEQFDLMVIGGGINGTGIARDAAGRGLSVGLCEQHDLAAHTSSASTKLIHGGLRYLEYGEFSLVRKALQEREILLASAPHIMWPLRFVMPHGPGQRPAWLIRCGLWLYDHLAERTRLPASRHLDLSRHPAGEPLQRLWQEGFEYSDGWVDDARLVVLNALDAAERGARILTYTTCLAARRDGEGWSLVLQAAGQPAYTVRARALVNAGGPWAGRLLGSVIDAPAPHAIRLVKGSHLIVRKLYDHPYAYLLQNPDGRILFAIPYQHDFTLIGTTDIEFDGDAANVCISPEETDYLCRMASRYFARPLTPADVVASYAGVRPLLDDHHGNASGVTRDYKLALDVDGAPLLSVLGGKLTTYRKLAEEAVNRLAPLVGATARGWTAGSLLPGGDLPDGNPALGLAALQSAFPWLPAALAARWNQAYGSRARQLPGDAANLAGLGEEVLHGLYATEIDYLRRVEWARTAEDILWRRSKLGLHLPAGAADTLNAWLAAHPLPAHPSQASGRP